MYFDYCENNIVFDNLDGFVEVMKGYGFQRLEVIDNISPLLKSSMGYFATTYFGYSCGGTSTAINFEKATTELFNKCFNIKATHIGQKKRPNNQIGGYPDILLEASNYISLVDTKASPKYQLSHDDVVKMQHTYIPHYKEPLDLDSTKPLHFVCYVAGGFSGNLSEKLKAIHEKTNIKGA